MLSQIGSKIKTNNINYSINNLNDKISNVDGEVENTIKKLKNGNQEKINKLDNLFNLRSRYKF